MDLDALLDNNGSVCILRLCPRIPFALRSTFFELHPSFETSVPNDTKITLNTTRSQISHNWRPESHGAVCFAIGLIVFYLQTI